MKTLKGGLSSVSSEDWKEVIEGAVQGCYRGKHRNNWRGARAVHALCENAPIGTCGPTIGTYRPMMGPNDKYAPTIGTYGQTVICAQMIGSYAQTIGTYAQQ